MKINRSMYGRSTDFELTREELQKAYQEYDELVLREHIVKFLQDKKGVISMDAYTGVVDACVKACRQEMASGKAKATALLDAINTHFKYMEHTPAGLLELLPGFSCIENFWNAPNRVCFCPVGIVICKDTPGYTGNDFLRLSDQNAYLAQSLFQFCASAPDTKPEDACALSNVKENARQMEADDRLHIWDLAQQRQFQQNRAIDFYNAITEQFGREADALQIALNIYQLMQFTTGLPEALSVSDASILAERIHSICIQSNGQSRDICLSSVISLLYYGMDANRCPALPSMSPADTKTFLLNCTPESFCTAISCISAFLQSSSKEYRPLEDPGLEKLFMESQFFLDGGKQTLDAQLSGARTRASADVL